MSLSAPHEESSVLVAARLRLCLSCIYPLFIWRASVSRTRCLRWWWILAAVVCVEYDCEGGGGLVLVVLVVGCLPFLYTHICGKRCPNSKKNKKIKVNLQTRATMMLCFVWVFFFNITVKKKSVGFISSKLSLIQHICMLLCSDFESTCRQTSKPMKSYTGS